MWRLLAISVALLLSVSLAAPLFASDAALGNLPECCRRSGRHRCAGGMTDSSGKSAPSIASHCLIYPSATAAPWLPALAADRGIERGVMLYVNPDAPGQTEAKYRISYARSRNKRGPPTHLL